MRSPPAPAPELHLGNGFAVVIAGARILGGAEGRILCAGPTAGACFHILIRSAATAFVVAAGVLARGTVSALVVIVARTEFAAVAARIFGATLALDPRVDLCVVDPALACGALL